MLALDALTGRHTVRQYDANHTMPRKDIEKIIEIAKMSPTGCNFQTLDLIAVANRQKIDELTQISYDAWSPEEQAGWNTRKEEYGVSNVVSCDGSLIVYVYANERGLANPTFVDVDTGLMVMSMIVAARALGYETMCYGAVVWGGKEKVEAALGIPANTLKMALVIGKPKEGELKLLNKEILTKATIIE